MHDHSDPREPYRLFFPLGLLMAAVGVAPWVLFHFGLLSSYPAVFHGRVMFHGFLMAFISGFLMTAVPRMSATEPCRPIEASVVLFLLGMQLAFGSSALASAAAFSAHAAFLLFFVLRRSMHRKQNPPPTFLFVPIGLVVALLGGLLLVFSDVLPNPLRELGKLWAFQAFVINLIIGLGSRLVPVLSRAPGALSPIQASQNGNSRHWIVLIGLNLSFLVEVFVDKQFGLGLRGLSLTWAAVIGLRVFAPMVPVTALGLALRASALFLVLPYFVMAVFPGAEIHWLHLVYVGGIGLMTLMVAVRVVLAHGGAGFEKEAWSPGLAAAATLMIAATLVRSLVPSWNPAGSFASYALAAVFWLIALGLWWITFGGHVKKPLAIFERRPS